MPASSRSQQRLFGMVHACQKSNKCASHKISKIAATIKPQDAKDFAKTKHDGLPEQKKSASKKTSFHEWLTKKGYAI
jgi:hypothetical protein